MNWRVDSDERLDNPISSATFPTLISNFLGTHGARRHLRRQGRRTNSYFSLWVTPLATGATWWRESRLRVRKLGSSSMKTSSASKWIAKNGQMLTVSTWPSSRFAQYPLLLMHIWEGHPGPYCMLHVSSHNTCKCIIFVWTSCTGVL